ncbi:Helix-turn-helix type 3 [Shewanella denitrificans OS217]|jgi:putative transcriptional regulator|uniref:Helix-turn-helix type 3 n=1 Tax=Shewanella denitrificans (strain OS217 / ATCC BAA-1090 / DSM 15013) TaxID=318161 RepID=Q12I53_SHEDO|nr:helix-turn-helix transcriptional regulator [Shewanella denitrificans]ABE56873.1 Helix-turn-helix type 3 [Shewanella denitrificans OS217]
MAIIIELDVVLAKRKMKSTELAELIGITPQNLSVLRSGRAKAIRFSTLDAICMHLQCTPGDILAHVDPDDSCNVIDD